MSDDRADVLVPYLEPGPYEVALVFNGYESNVNTIQIQAADATGLSKETIAANTSENLVTICDMTKDLYTTYLG